MTQCPGVGQHSYRRSRGQVSTWPPNAAQHAIQPSGTDRVPSGQGVPSGWRSGIDKGSRPRGQCGSPASGSGCGPGRPAERALAALDVRPRPEPSARAAAPSISADRDRRRRRARRRSPACGRAPPRRRGARPGGQRTASPAATRSRSPSTTTQPPPSMTMNQVVFGFVCGSIRPFRANASSLITPRPSLWITWPVTPGRAGRPVLPAMADPEPADLDRHRALPIPDPAASR